MPRIPHLGPRLLPLLLAAVPTAALAESPAGEAVTVAAVPAYAVAPPGLAAPGLAPVAAAQATDDEPAAAEAVGIARRVVDDRVADRGYLAPTALVAPRGATTLTLQAPLAPGASLRLDRSFSDRLSLGVGVVGVVDGNDLVGIGSVHGKYQLWRGRRAALAVTGSIYNVPAESDIADGDSLTLVVPGLAASMCTDDACRTLVSIDVEALAGVDDQRLPIVGGVSLATGVKRQLIAELHTTTVDDDRLWLGFIGGRFIGRKLALDVGLGFAAVSQTTAVADCIDFCPESDTSSVDAVPWPFVALSSRL